jgi:hypothetical protein
MSSVRAMGRIKAGATIDQFGRKAWRHVADCTGN